MKHLLEKTWRLPAPQPKDSNSSQNSQSSQGLNDSFMSTDSFASVSGSPGGANTREKPVPPTVMPYHKASLSLEFNSMLPKALLSVKMRAELKEQILESTPRLFTSIAPRGNHARNSCMPCMWTILFIMLFAGTASGQQLVHDQNTSGSTSDLASNSYNSVNIALATVAGDQSTSILTQRPKGFLHQKWFIGVLLETVKNSFGPFNGITGIFASPENTKPELL